MNKNKKLFQYPEGPIKLVRRNQLENIDRVTFVMYYLPILTCTRKLNVYFNICKIILLFFMSFIILHVTYINIIL